MTAPFNDYCEMNHIAKQVGGPKIYSSILVVGGMMLGIAAFEGLPRLAACVTLKIENATNTVKSFLTETKRSKSTSSNSSESTLE